MTKIYQQPDDDLDDLSQEELEAEAEDTESEEVTEPFNPALIRIEMRPLTIDLLKRRLHENEIDLSPAFQRKGGLWNSIVQSRLIESLLIKLPIPALYLDATDDEKWKVVDGLQRLTTLDYFLVKQNIALKGLEFLTRYNRKKFSELPRAMQRRIEETQVLAYLIQPGTPDSVKFNLFKRINTGGLPLSAQEIRHAINQGPAVHLLDRLANSKEFRDATSHGMKDERMDARECVLRVFAFMLVSPERYRSNDLDSFLNEQMKNLNQMTDYDRDFLANRFLRAMQAAYLIFGREAFRKKYTQDAARYRINKALLEAWAVNLHRLTDSEIDLLIRRKSDLTAAFIRLMNERDFDISVSQGTGDVRKVGLRFSRIRSIIEEVLS